MLARHLFTVAATATGTALLTLAVLWPNQLEAKGPNKPKNARRALITPAIEVNGCRIELLSSALAPDKLAVLKLKVINPTGKPVRLSTQLSLTAQSPRSRFSRRMVLPKVLWRKTHTLTIAPGKTEIIELPTKVKIPAGKSAGFEVRAGKRVIRSVPLPLLMKRNPSRLTLKLVRGPRN